MPTTIMMFDKSKPHYPPEVPLRLATIPFTAILFAIVLLSILFPFHGQADTPGASDPSRISVVQGQSLATMRDGTADAHAGPAYREAQAERSLNLTAEEAAWLARHPVVRVAALTDYPPFEFRDVQGRYTGIAPDMLMLVAERAGFTVVPHFKTWPECLDALREKRMDLLPELVITEDRRDFLHFTKPYLSAPHVLAVRGDSPMRTSEDLAGKRMALEKGYYTVSFVAEHLPEVEILEVDSGLDALMAVSTGQADAYLSNVALISFLIENNFLTGLRTLPFPDLAPLELAMGVRKDWPELIPILEKALQSITRDERRTIFQGYAPHAFTEEASLELNAGQRAWLTENTEFRMAVSGDWPPFEFIDQDGGHSGISADYARWLEKTLSVRLQAEAGRTWTEMLEAVRSGEVDVISSIVANEERAEYLHFTRPFLEVPMVIATRDDAEYVESLDRLAGKTVAVIRGYIIQTYLERDHPDVDLLLLDNAEDCLRAVAEGRAFAMVETGLVLHYLTNKLGLQNITIAAPTPYTYDLSFGVRKDLPELAAILDAALAAVPATDRAVFSERWNNVRFERDMDWTPVWRWALALALVGAVILGMILHWNRKLFKEATSRKVAEMKMRAMSDASHDAVIMINGKGIVLFWNATAERMFGIPAEQALNTPMHQIFVPEAFREAAAKGLEEFARTGRGAVVGAVVEHEALRKDGTRFPVEIAVSSFQLEGEWYAVGTVRDITSRKQAEQAIFESQRKMRTLIDNIPAVVLMKDLHGRYLMANAMFTVVTGVDFRDVIGQTDQDVFPADVARGIMDMDRKTLDGGENVKFEEDVPHQDGTVRSYETVNAPLIDDDGKVYGMVGVSVDITDRLQARKALAEKQAFLQAIIDNSSTLIYVKDLEGRYILGNAAWRGTSAAGIADPLGLTDFDLFPEDLARDIQENDRLTLETLEARSWEESATSVDGAKVEYYSIKFPLLDGDGKVYAVCGMSTDITKRKEAEEIVNVYFNSSADGLMILSPERGFIHANQTAVAMYGFDNIADLLKCGPVELSPPHQADGRPSLEAARGYITQAIEMDKLLRFDWIHLRRDGTHFDCEVTLVGFQIGGKRHVLVNVRDITDRKAAEQVILQAKEQVELAGQRFSTLFEMSPIGMALVDHATGDFIEVNRSVLESTGYTKEEFTRLDYWELTPKEYEAQEMRQIEELNTTGRFGPNEKEYIRKDGSRYPLRIQGFILTDTNGRKVVWDILEDISELKKREQEIEKRTREVHESNLRLRDNLDQLERFSRLVVGREERMIELKAEINDLLAGQGLGAKYKIVE